MESILFRCYQFYLVATNFILCSRLHLVKKIISLSQIKSDFVKTNLKSLPPNLFIWNEFLFLDSEFYFVGTTLQKFLMNIFNSIHRKITDKAQQHIYKVLTTFCQKKNPHRFKRLTKVCGKSELWHSPGRTKFCRANHCKLLNWMLHSLGNKKWELQSHKLK